jgi:hypothetical protein
MKNKGPQQHLNSASAESSSLSSSLDAHRRARPTLVLQESPTSSCSNRASVELKNDTECTYPADLQQHPDLWFTDGSVVLRAENTLFKVHISQLSRHSVLFHDLFSLPQANDAPLTPNSGSLARMDGCPVVHLHDSAEDVGNLLAALYDGPCVST